MQDTQAGQEEHPALATTYLAAARASRIWALPVSIAVCTSSFVATNCDFSAQEEPSAFGLLPKLAESACSAAACAASSAVIVAMLPPTFLHPAMPPCSRLTFLCPKAVNKYHTRGPLIAPLCVYTTTWSCSRMPSRAILALQCSKEGSMCGKVAAVSHTRGKEGEEGVNDVLYV